jgi:hypothetical protein
MKEGIQNDLGDEAIKKWGCFFLCIARLAEKAADEAFSSLFIRFLKSDALRLKYIDEEMTVIKHAKLFKLMSNRFCEYEKVYTKPEGDYIQENCGQTKSGDIVTHFTAFVDGAEFDPLDPKRQHVEYRPVSYRVFEVV